MAVPDEAPRGWRKILRTARVGWISAPGGHAAQAEAGPARRAAPLLSRGPAAVGGALLAAALATVAVNWNARKAPALPRRGASFPAPPDLNSAISAAEARLKDNPQDLGALVQLGVLHFEKGKEHHIDAINELEEARELGAMDSRIFYCLGVLYQDAGLYAFALEEYKRFLRNHPEDREVRLLAAKLLYQQGRFSDAVQEYERLRYHFPKDPLVEENLGLSLLGAKFYDRAAEAFEALRARSGDFQVRADFFLGQVNLERGRPEAALTHLRAYLPEASRAADLPRDRAWAWLAASHGRLGQLEPSRDAWKKVLELAPNDSDAKKALKDLDRKLARKPKPAKSPKR